MRALYDVDVDVIRHGAGRLRYRARSPLGREAATAPPSRRRHIAASAGCCCGALVTAPLVGSTPNQPAARVRLVDPVRRQRGRADLLHRAAAAHARRRAGRRRPLAAAGVVFQGLLRNPLATPFTLGVSAGAALGAMLAITFAPALQWLGVPVAPLASFAGSLAAPSPSSTALATARHRGLSTNVAAARRRDDERVLLGADPVRAVLRRLRRDVPHPALADGRSRRQQLRPLWSRRCRWWSSSFAAFAWLARPLNLLSLGTDSRGDPRPRRRRARSASRSSAPRSPPAPPFRSAARSASSASSFRTWCG